MTEVKKEITNLLIKPLKDPRHAKKIKKKIGGTMLLYGPPGCGKTYVARAAVGETGLPFFNVNLSDISRLGASDGAKALHEVFSEAAKNAPAIVFFDEIDSIGGVRKEGQKEKERLGVTQLLVELDGAESLTEKVLVIGATNMPWALDPALRRAGRFTRQIYVGPPEEKTRRELFRKHLKDTPKKKIDYTALAEKTEKYSAADISAICELAGQKLWEKEALEEEDLKSALEKHTSSLSAWYKLAEKELRKSGEETFYQEMTGNILSEAGGLDEERDIQVRFQDVGGMEDVKQEIRKSIIYPLEKPELAQRYGKRSGGAILFYGPPGCGKTYMAKATAGECNAAFYNVELSNLCGDDAEKKIAEVFERAKRNTPAVLFFDEIEALAGRREKAVGPEKKLINQLLVELDGFKENKDLLVIAATNSPWEIDPAFRRAGRFTRQVLISPPDRETREEIFRIHTRDKPLDEELALSDLADITRGYSSADIKEICELAAEIPWDEALFGGEVRDIKTEDFLEAIEKQDPSILPWLSSALESLKDSKEEKLYHEMYDMIEAFFNEDKAIEPEVVYPEEEEDELSRELRELEEKIRVAEEKYKEGVIGREDYDLLMGHYRKKLAEMEGRLHEKPLGEPGSFLGISPGDDGMVWMKDMEWTVGTHPSGKLHYRIRSMRGDVFRD